MAVRIRRYHQKDLFQVARCFSGLQEQTVAIDQARFYRAKQDFDAEKYTRTFVHNIISAGQIIFVAESEGKLVGHMVLAVETLNEKERLEFYCKKKRKHYRTFHRTSIS